MIKQDPDDGKEDLIKCLDEEDPALGWVIIIATFASTAFVVWQFFDMLKSMP